MKQLFYRGLLPGVFALFVFGSFQDNQIIFPIHLRKTTIASLREKDSLCYYQCYCAAAGSEPVYLHRDSVKKHSLKKGIVTVTEKFALSKNGNTYRLRHYTSSLYDFPNKKFAYLKLTEKEYWNFILVRDTLLGEESVLKLAALELKLRPLTEYNFKIVEDNYPQLIINGRRISEQRMVEGNYLIKKELGELSR